MLCFLLFAECVEESHAVNQVVITVPAAVEAGQLRFIMIVPDVGHEVYIFNGRKIKTGSKKCLLGGNVNRRGN